MPDQVQDSGLQAPPELTSNPAEDIQPDQASVGGDIQSQIVEGVRAYVDSGDPQVAVQVVELLASQLGLTGDESQPAAQPLSEQAAPSLDGSAPAEEVQIAKKGGVIRKTALQKYIESLK